MALKPTSITANTDLLQPQIRFAYPLTWPKIISKREDCELVCSHHDSGVGDGPDKLCEQSSIQTPPSLLLVNQPKGLPKRPIFEPRFTHAGTSYLMRICNASGEWFGRSTTQHKASPVPVCLVSSGKLMLWFRQLLLQEFIHHKMDHGLAYTPPRSSQAFPKSKNTRLSVDTWNHSSEVASRGPVELQPGFDEPDRVGHAGGHETCRKRRHAVDKRRVPVVLRDTLV